MTKWEENVRENGIDLQILWCNTHPRGYMWTSYLELFGWGLREGLITQSEWEDARKYYGKMWSYAGD